jgi:hypothetical protein
MNKEKSFKKKFFRKLIYNKDFLISIKIIGFLF